MKILAFLIVCLLSYAVTDALVLTRPETKADALSQLSWPPHWHQTDSLDTQNPVIHFESELDPVRELSQSVDHFKSQNIPCSGSGDTKTMSALIYLTLEGTTVIINIRPAEGGRLGSSIDALIKTTSRKENL